MFHQEPKLPKGAEKLAKKYADRVDNIWMEDDGYGNTYVQQDRPSYWVGLKKGWWNPMTECTGLHTCTLKELEEALRGCEKI